jgi:GNAT superfamily N-acetyltransferase
LTGTPVVWLPGPPRGGAAAVFFRHEGKPFAVVGHEEFRDTYQGKDPDREQAQLVKGLAHGDIRFGLYKGGRLCAVAGSTSCGPQSAMLIGVATRKEERGNGYAHAVVTALCQEHFREGRQSVCLFWDNPDAWRMYQRMGFRPRWSVHHGVSPCLSEFVITQYSLSCIRYLPSSLLQEPDVCGLMEWRVYCQAACRMFVAFRGECVVGALPFESHWFDRDERAVFPVEGGMLSGLLSLLPLKRWGSSSGRLLAGAIAMTCLKSPTGGFVPDGRQHCGGHFEAHCGGETAFFKDSF